MVVVTGLVAVALLVVLGILRKRSVVGRYVNDIYVCTGGDYNVDLYSVYVDVTILSWRVTDSALVCLKTSVCTSLLSQVK